MGKLSIILTWLPVYRLYHSVTILLVRVVARQYTTWDTTVLSLKLIWHIYINIPMLSPNNAKEKVMEQSIGIAFVFTHSILPYEETMR